MATKRRRGGTWHYRVRNTALLPRPVYLSFHDEAEGDEYVRRLEALLARGVVPHEFAVDRGPKPVLGPAVDRYVATQAVTADDAHVLLILQSRLPPHLPLADLTYQWATRWITALKREQNLAPSTVRKHVGALARCLDWLTRSGDVPFNPLRALPRGYATYTAQDRAVVDAGAGRGKVDVERDRRLEPGEEAAIRAMLAGAKQDGHQRAFALREQAALVMLFDMALESAMRMREMYTLHVAQVDLPRRTIFLDKTKNGSKRQVPVTTVLGARLAAYLVGRDPDELIFPWWDGDTSRASLRRTTSRLSIQFGRIFSAAGCPDLRFHDLRHEATSRIFERTTLNTIEIATITGHKDLRTLKRYANLRASTLAERLW